MPTSPALHKWLLVNENLPMYRKVSERLELETPDPERIIRVLEHFAEQGLAWDLMNYGFEHEEDKVNDDLPYAGVMARGNASTREISIIKSLLRQKLWLPPDNRRFRNLFVESEEPAEPHPADYLAPLVDAQRGGTIATINYDNALETIRSEQLRVIEPGTKQVRVPSVTPTTTRYLKLHGSLDWERVGDDVIAGAEPLGKLGYDPAIIFGAGNKLRHYGPFLDLLRAFTDALRSSTVVVTIGYSFRDPHINEAIRTWAEDVESGEKRLVVGLGPQGRWLPAFVKPLKTREHLHIDGADGTATEMISELFPTLPA